MRKTIKTFLLALSFSVCIFGLLSCTDNSAGSQNNNQNNSGVIDQDVIYSQNVEAALVLGEGVSAKSASPIKSAYHELVGKELKVSSSAASHEIIVGKSARDISAKAYRALELISHDDGNVGYVIYSDGKSVALAFDGAAFGENVALACAVENFVKMYMRTDTLKLGAGVAYYERFDPIEKQAERDAEALDLLWELKLSQISEKMGGKEESAKAVVAELQKLYDIYNNNYSIVKWVADLYDPETGGFYHSNSARNNVGYLPDLESTSQALSLIELMLSGYGGTLTDYFGEEIAAKFVSFVKNMQDANGYFYHPQWKRELADKNSEKKTRDVVNALTVLGFFGANPTYDTPNGVKGDGGVSAVSNITVPLKLTGVSAVSRLVSAESDEIFIPNHLKTKESFESYLSGLNIKTDTATVSEALYSEVPLYLAIDEILAEDGASYRLTDILRKYLSARQSEYTGLWSSSSTDLNTAIANLASVVKIYNAMGITIPSYSTVLDTIVSAIESLNEPQEIADVVGLWTSFYLVVNNLTTYSSEDQIHDVALNLRYVYSDFAVLIQKTMANVALFSRADGSFSTTQTSSMSEMMGMPIALPDMDEGDMSATALATKNLLSAIFGALDIGRVPIFTASDRMVFEKTFLDLGIVIKNEVKEIEPIDFEDYEPGNSLDIRHEFNSTESLIEVVKDPLRDGNSARLYSASNKGAKFDFFYFDIMSSVKNASCYSYELDMCVLPETSSGTFAQLYLYQDVYMISLKRSGDTINFYEHSSRTSSVTRTMDVGVTAEVGEWFNLRVEYYPAPHGSVRIKIYFNGECVVVSDNYFGCHASSPLPSTNFKNFCIYGYQKLNMDVLVDNVAVETSYQTYTVETGRLNRNVDYPDKQKTVHDFEKNDNGDTPVLFTPTDTKSGAVVITDGEGNKALSLSEKIGEITLPLDSRGSGINSALVEFEFVLSDKSKNGAVYQISFGEYKYDNSVFGSMYIVVKEENGSLYATLSDTASDSGAYEGVKIYAGEKLRIGFRLFFDEQAIVVSVGEDVVGINSSVEAVNRYYLGEIKLISKTPSITSEILIDNVVVEKAASSFDEATAPDVDRVTVGFDTTDGIELSGVGVSGGVLSFENAQSGSFVKIPVNLRASAPTVALVGFDVSASGEAGSINIRLSDKDGNIIATFVLASLNGKISVYELTANGRYPTPIYTFSKSDFNFSFEYSKSRGNFNILVDGEYVAASSITHTWESGDYSFDYLTVSCSANAGFAIDNLYAEQICGVFKVQKIATPNQDPVNGVFTYETSSFASMPTQIERILGDPTAYHGIKEANIKGVVSKVLEMNCGTANGASFSIFSKTKTAQDSDAVYFESDLMLKATTTALYMLFEIQSSSGTAYSMAITSGGENMPLSISGKEIGVTEGEWFKLRIEYRDAPHDFNYDGKNDVVTRIYVNGNMISEAYTPYDINNIVSAGAVSKIRVRNSSGRAGIVYFDNTVLGDCNMTYTPPAPPDTHTLTYEPGIITSVTKGTLKSKGASLSIANMTVAGEVSKMLKFTTASGAEDKLDISKTVTADGVNAIVFETDLMINTSQSEALFYIEPFTKAGKQPFSLTLFASSGGEVTVSAKDIPETVIGKCGELIHLKIVYMNPELDYTGDGKRDIICKIYVGGSDTPIAVGYTPYNSSSYYAPRLIETYRITSAADTAMDLYLDNTRFWQVVTEYDEGGVPPVEEEDAMIGDPGFDSGAWA